MKKISLGIILIFAIALGISLVRAMQSADFPASQSQ